MVWIFYGKHFSILKGLTGNCSIQAGGGCGGVGVGLGKIADI